MVLHRELTQIERQMLTSELPRTHSLFAEEQRKFIESECSCSIVQKTCFPPLFINTNLESSRFEMEVDLKRVARLEYLKLRQSKQAEKIDAVKVC